MAIKIKIISVGKTKESWLQTACDEYIKRLKAEITIETLWVKDDSQLIESALKEKNRVCLDESGLEVDSVQFSEKLRGLIEAGRGPVTFIIGGSEGLPIQLKEHSQKISFSRLTFTHQMVRLILFEQIYRSSQLWKGTSYHK